MDLTGLVEKKNKAGTVYYTDNEEEIVAKICTGGCEKIKSLGDFSKRKRGLGGRASWCRDCMSNYNRAWHVENRERRSEYNRKWGEVNKERRREYRREWYEVNKERQKEYVRKWYETNKDYAVEYRIINRERYRKLNQIWSENNRDRIARYASLRRTRVRGLPSTLSDSQWECILAKFEYGCALSEDTEDIHMDHVIPVSIGHGGTIYENMIPLRADLNISKSDRNIFDWFADNRERFGLSQRKFDDLIEYLADINDMTVEEYEEYVRWCHDNPRSINEIKEREELEEMAT